MKDDPDMHISTEYEFYHLETGRTFPAYSVSLEHAQALAEKGPAQLLYLMGRAITASTVFDKDALEFFCDWWNGLDETQKDEIGKETERLEQMRQGW